MKTAWLSAAGIVLVTLAAYWPALSGGFLWDDDTLITANPVIRARDGLFRIWFTSDMPDYYPVTNSFAWLQWRWWGRNPTGYHAVNVLLHAANAVLVWQVLRRLQVPGARVAGVVFAAHPVNVATAAWICEQKNTLSLLFAATTVLLYLRFEEDRRPQWYALALLAFLLALLSKSAVVALPAALLLIVWWKRGRLEWADALRSVPFFAMAAILGLVTLRFQAHHRAMLDLEPPVVSLSSHLAMAGSVPWFYLSKTLLPVGLTLVYPDWQITDSRPISLLLGVVLVALFAVSWWKRDAGGRALLLGLGYFVLMLFPVLGFFDQTFYRYASVADHWQYYSIIGPIALVGAGIVRLANRWDTRARYWGRLAATAVIGLLMVGTSARARVYASNIALWQDNVNKQPGAFVAHHNLGYALAEAGRLHEAVPHFETAIQLRPDFFRSHFNLGSALAQLGRIDDAIRRLQLAVRLKPDSFEAQNNLANALAQARRLPEAIEHYRAALLLDPGLADTRFNLGLALEQAGQTNAAVAEYELALQLDPHMRDAQIARQRIR